MNFKSFKTLKTKSFVNTPVFVSGVKSEDIEWISEVSGYGCSFYNKDEMKSEEDRIKYQTILRENCECKVCYLIEESSRNEMYQRLVDILEGILKNGEYDSLQVIDIYLIGEESVSLAKLPEKYDYMKGVDIRSFFTRKEAIIHAMMKEAIGADDRVASAFKPITVENRLEYYLENCKELGLKSILENTSPFIRHFFRSYILEGNIMRGTLIGFDYIEFMMGLIYFYYRKKSGIEEAEKEKHILSIGELAEEILKYSSLCPEGVDLSKKQIQFEYYSNIERVNHAIQKRYGFVFQGESFNFRGAVGILNEIRNRTKGHGVIRADDFELWKFINAYFALLSGFLSFETFRCEVKENQLYCGYEELIDISPYGIVQGGVPCLTYQKRGKQREYINYFRGQYSIPEVSTISE